MLKNFKRIFGGTNGATETRVGKYAEPEKVETTEEIIARFDAIDGYGRVVLGDTEFIAYLGSYEENKWTLGRMADGSPVVETKRKITLIEV